MTGSHQRDKSAEAFWRQLLLKEVHQSSCLFVFIRGSSSLSIGRFSSNDPHGRAGARLNTYFQAGVVRQQYSPPVRNAHYPPWGGA